MTTATVARSRGRGGRAGREPGARWRRDALVVVAVVVGSAATFAFVRLLGHRAGPTVTPFLIIGLPVAVILLGAMLARPLVGVVAACACLPLGLVHVPKLPLQGMQVVVVLAVGAAALHRIAHGSAPLPWHPVLWWGAAIVALALVATPSAASLDLAVRQDLNLAAGLLLVPTVVAVCRRFADVRLLVTVMVLAGTVITVQGLLSARQSTSQAGGAIVYNITQGPFTEHNQLGAFSAFVLLLAVGLLLGARRTRERALGVVASVIALVSLGLSLSRGAWIGTMVGGLVLIVVLPRARRAVLVTGVPLIVAAAVFGSFAPDNPQLNIVRDRLATVATPANNPYDDRPKIWREAVREIIADPLSGQGPGSFPVVSARAASGTSVVAAQHAHNVLLTVAAEIGVFGVPLVIGLTVGLGLMLSRTVQSLRVRLPDDAALLAAVGASLATFMGQGLVDVMVGNSMLLLLMFLLSGLIIAAARIAEGAAAVTPVGRSAGP